MGRGSEKSLPLFFVLVNQKIIKSIAIVAKKDICKFAILMKAKFLLTILLFISILSFGQTPNSDHLLFKGIPIDGTLEQFVSKMKENGFTLLNSNDGVAMFSGDFAGYKDCIIGVSTLKQKNLVHKVAVIFPFKSTWSTLSENYFVLKQLLTEKYGEASDVVEKFEGFVQPNDDKSKMHEVEFDRCKFNSTYLIPNGTIELSIQHAEYNSFIRLFYFDNINNDLLRAKAKDDL